MIAEATYAKLEHSPLIKSPALATNFIEINAILGKILQRL
jgi:hypothetical protein